MKKILLLIALAVMATIAKAENENLCIKFTTTSAAVNIWDSQAYYNLSAPLVKDEAYTLTAKIKSTQENAEFALWPIWAASENRDQWGGSADVQYEAGYKLTTEWATYTWKFKANFPHDRLQFVFGGLNGSIYMDDIVLKADAVGVNCIQNGDFAENSTKGWDKPSWHQLTITVVDSDSDTAPEVKEPEIPDTWEIAQQGDPNFHIYLCFGQSNMEGATQPEAQDYENVPDRFQMMAAVNYNNPKRTKGEWYVATPPLCREGTGLTPADYFGRKLVEKLPEDVKVGVINVAVGGAKIELYMEEYKDAYIAGEADWFKNICKQYDNDPLGRLIEMGKKAQETGTIKGILLHQGESNCGQADWAEKVKKVYTRLCYYLGLDPQQTPLLAGECLYEDQGGGCAWHNIAALPKLPEVLPNSYVISADGIPGNGQDPWHFSAEGYRQLGHRYAEKMIEILNSSASIDNIADDKDLPIRVFDINGRLVKNTSVSGFYIIDGEKVLVK